jgi:hypothetical protein
MSIAVGRIVSQASGSPPDEPTLVALAPQPRVTPTTATPPSPESNASSTGLTHDPPQMLEPPSARRQSTVSQASKVWVAGVPYR